MGGRVIDALDYGLHYEDIDPAEEKLRQMWARAQGRWRELNETVQAIETIFDENGWAE